MQEEFNLSPSGFPDEIGRRGQCAHAAECGRTGSARRPLHAVSGTQEMPPASAAPPQGLSTPSPGGAAPVPQNEPCGKKRVTGGESPGPRHPQASAGPAPPRPWPPSSSHLGSPLLLPSSPALCSPKDRASPSHDSHCPASSLPGLCMGGLAPALPTHAATPATSAGGARDARPTTWPQAPLTDKAYSRLIPGTTSSRKPSVYPTHLPCSPRPRISSLGPAIPAVHRRHFRLTRPK